MIIDPISAAAGAFVGAIVYHLLFVSGDDPDDDIEELKEEVDPNND